MLSAGVFANMSAAAPAKTEAPSRRIRKRERTRVQIRDVALSLFRERGFDNVTIAEIAEAADVDATTFWRHFGSKHAVLYSDHEEWIGELKAAFAAAPADASPYQAAILALEQASSSLKPPLFPDTNVRDAKAEARPEVKAATLAFRDIVQREMTQQIAQRMGVKPEADSRPAILASVILSAALWTRDNQRGSLLKVSIGKRRAALNAMITNALKLID
jgi:AcrR family transcriptional regulator